MHRNEKYFENPLEFIPERFTEERSHNNAYSYIPFAAGTRNCIGQKFALLEIKTVISKILQKFVLKLDEGFEVQCVWEVILKPINGVYLKMERRKELKRWKK